MGTKFGNLGTYHFWLVLILANSIVKKNFFLIMLSVTDQFAL